jgi:O-antigen/teichoic acid export membrane protein
MMSTYASGLVAAEDFASQVSSSISSSLVNLLGVSMTLIFHWGLVGLASSLLASRVIDLAMRRHLYMRRVQKDGISSPGGESLSPELRRRMIRFCSYSTCLLLLSVVVWDRSEVFFLKWFCNIKEVAFYSVGFNLVQQLVVLPRMFTNPATARMMVEYGQDRRMSAEVTGMTARYLALFALPMMLGMAAISGPLVTLVYGPAYAPAAPVLAIAASLAIARCFVTQADQLMFANEQQNTLLKWGVCTAVLNIGLDFLLIRSHGAIGAAIANGVTQFIATVGSWTFATRRCGVQFPLVSTGKLLAASMIMAGAVTACSVALRPTIALAAGVPLGIILFVLSMRVLRPFDSRDRARLMSVGKLLPGIGSRLYTAALGIAIPISPADKQQPLATTA